VEECRRVDVDVTSDLLANAGGAEECRRDWNVPSCLLSRAQGVSPWSTFDFDARLIVRVSEKVASFWLERWLLR